MKFTDSHCHLASQKFTLDEIDSIIQRAGNNGIHRMVTLATNLDDIEDNIRLSEEYPQIYCALGIHPCDVHNTPDDYLPTLRNHAQHPHCVAIGETGLDYFHPAPEGWTDSDYHTRQRKFLRQHFQLAADLNKNIVIHTRDKSGKQSLDDAVSIYSDYSDRVTAVFHCFLGPWENAQPILDLGGYLSYTGIATFKKATDTINSAIQTPANRIMVETDSPYLAPIPHRGQRNEPGFTLHTASHIADERGMDLAEFSSITERNVENFYKLPTAP